ncbi:MAG: transporter substrate-binding domain-containing protein [Methylocystaceae bacterium]|nr:transporter substrate-binding domain-containing protein [Methylocystaceae bacterium]
MKKFWFIIVMVTIALFGMNAFAASNVQLTEKERQFISELGTIRVSNEMDWPPYNYNERNQPKGFSIDYFKLVAEKLGITYEFVSGPSWNDFLMMTKRNELDVVLNIISTPERRKYLAFTKPYTVAISGLVVTERMRHLTSLREMDGMTVAVPQGFYTAELLRAIYPNIKRFETKDTLGALEAVKFGQADAMVSEIPVANFLMEKHTLSGLSVSGKIKDPAFASIFSMATRLDKTMLRDVLEKGINAVTDEEIFAIRSKWLERTNDKTEPNILTLSEREVAYLKKHDDITMCVDPDWLPFEAVRDGEHVGISGDYVRTFAQKLDKPFRLIKTESWSQSLEFAQERKCDILPMLSATPERIKYLNFTKPYFNNANVIVTRHQTAYVPELSQLDAEVGVVEGYALNDTIRAFYPNIQIRNVKNLHAGMKLVAEGKLFAMAGSLAAVGYQIQDYFIGQLKVAGRFDEPLELGLGVRNDDMVLLSILNKAIDSISDDEHRRLVNSWMVVTYKEGLDLKLLIEILIGFSFIAFFLLYRQRGLKKHNEELARISSMDKLTNLKNRMALDDILITQFNQFDRYKRPFSVIILDVDHFKSINDTYGHLVGDEVLVAVAKIITSVSRSTDTTGRWGGEEFLILCPETDQEGTRTVAEHFREAIEGCVFDQDIRVTASFGVAEARLGESAQDLMKRADAALYKAKHNGRNQVCIG